MRTGGLRTVCPPAATATRPGGGQKKRLPGTGDILQERRRLGPQERIGKRSAARCVVRPTKNSNGTVGPCWETCVAPLAWENITGPSVSLEEEERFGSPACPWPLSPCQVANHVAERVVTVPFPVHWAFQESKLLRLGSL